MATVINATTNTIDYTTQLTAIQTSLATIAAYYAALGTPSTGGLSDSFKRAMTVNALKSGGQLQSVINEMNHPTVLPGGG